MRQETKHDSLTCKMKKSEIFSILLNYNSLQNKAHQKKRKTKFYIDLELKQKY